MSPHRRTSVAALVAVATLGPPGLLGLLAGCGDDDRAADGAAATRVRGPAPSSEPVDDPDPTADTAPAGAPAECGFAFPDAGAPDPAVVTYLPPEWPEAPFPATLCVTEARTGIQVMRWASVAGAEEILDGFLTLLEEPYATIRDDTVAPGSLVGNIGIDVQFRLRPEPGGYSLELRGP